MELAQAFVRLRVDPTRVARDTTKGIESGAAAAGTARAGSRAAGSFGSGFTGGLRKQLPAFAREGERAGSSYRARLGRSLGSAVGLVGKFGAAALAGVGVASVKMATDFNSSMKMIQTQAGGSAKDVKYLSAQVLKLGTYAQQSPKELADALFHLKSVGLDNAKAMRALKVSADLAAVGGANLEDTTNALAGAWRSGIKGAQNFHEAAATVNAIIGVGNMRMKDLVAAIGTGILPAAKTFGLSLKSVGAALALMTDEGIPARQAATRLRMAFSLLGAPSAAAEKQLKRIGVTGLQLAQAMRSKGGIVAAIALLKSHLDKSGLSAAKQSQLLSRAFGGGRQSAAILTLINNLGTLRRKQEQLNKATGRYDSAVAAQRRTAKAQFALLRSSIDVLLIKIGNKLLPMLNRVVHWLNRGHNLTLALKVAFGILLGATVAWGTAFIIATSGIPLIIGAIAAAVLLIATNWKKIWRVIGPIIKRIGWVFGEVAKVIITEWKLVVTSVLAVIGTIIHAAAKAFGWIPGIGGKLKAADRAFQSFRGHVKNTFDSAINTISKWQNKLLASGHTAKNVTAKINGYFRQQEAAAKRAKNGIDDLGTSVALYGKKSDNARASRRRLLHDMEKAGVDSKTARRDVSRYTDAVASNGIRSDKAKAARKRLIDDLTGATQHSRKAKQDMATYTRAVQQEGAKSDAARGARHKLITDLQKSGLNARDARKLVDQLTRSIKNTPKSKSTQVIFGLHLPKGVHVSSSFASKRTKYGYAAGTSGAAPGWAWVGEKGPELAYFHGGEQVLSHADSQRAMGGYANGTLPHPKFLRGYASGTMAYPHNPAQVAKIWQTLYKAALKGVLDAGSQAVGTYLSKFTGGPSAYGGSAAAKAFARRMLAAYGWGPGQWPPLLALWNQESGWNPRAVNPSSGAYGIPQALGHGHPYALGDYANQIRWGLNYIRSRYGSPSAAWAHEVANNWYGNGGTINEPIAGVGLRTGQHYRFGERGGEQVTPSAMVRAQNDLLRKIERHLKRIADNAPAETGAQIAGALNGGARLAAHRGAFSTRPRGR